MENTLARSQAKEAPARAPLGREGAVLLALSASAALLFTFVHTWPLFPLGTASHAWYGPGIGLALTHWTLTAAALIAAKRRNRLRPDRGGVFLLAVSVLLSAAYAAFANRPLRVLNLPVLLLVTGQALFSLTGRNTHPALSGQGLWEGFRRYGRNLFRYGRVPFQSAAAGSGRKAGARYILIGLIVAVCVALLAGALLCSADPVFSGMLNNAIDQLPRMNTVSLVIRLAFMAALALALFSLRFSLLQEAAEVTPVRAGSCSPTVFCMVLGTLALLYALFGYVQVRYLFAGEESVRMSGGYAAYARSGFFQLAAVALLTLCVILPALILCRKSPAVRVLCTLTAVLTGVIDVSAWLRMHLYIGAYGLSTLRVVTVWGIGVILLALLAVAGKCCVPEWKICPLLAAVILASWAGLNWANVDRLVAENQAARFNALQEEREYTPEDIRTLFSDQDWSPDYYAALGTIRDPGAREEARKALDGNGRRPDGSLRLAPSLYDWSFAFLRME